jgi:2,3-dihydro-2,3-dihydroxybenzoate dehydrogenase
MEDGLVLVTGAAGGIGAATVRLLAQQGAQIAAVDTDEPGLCEQTAKLCADGLSVTAFPGDVTRPEQVQNTVRQIEDRLGPIDALVNAAGILRLGDATALTEDDWAASFAVNTTGVFLMSRAVVNRMLPRGRGAVVTVASNAAGTPRQGMAAYAATKCLGLEVARHGIRCNVVSPGSTDTAMLRGMWTDESGPQVTLDGRLDAYRVGIPLRKLASPADIANAVVFLLSKQAGHITMHDLTVDGGATLGV